MDPNVALRELREAIEAWHGLGDSDDAPCEAETDAALKVINAAEDIDAWLTRGGYLPTEWGERANCTDPDKGEFHCCGEA